MTLKTSLRRITIALLSFGVLALSAQADDKNSQFYELDIDALPLTAAVKTLSDETGIEVLFFSEIAKGVTSSPVQGEYTPTEALETMLNSTDLKVVALKKEGAVAIAMTATEERGPSDSKNSQPTSVLMAQSQSMANPGSAVPNRDMAENSSDETEVRLEEIVVIGSNIRGARSASSIFEFSREDIDRSGVATLPQLMQRIPQNFRGGASEDIPATDSGGSNFPGATGVNLRGLGSSATLVLINGRRLAQGGGSDATFVDISNLPLAAIDRIEVLTDGASAIYGSDAIAGVVNFVLRDDYDGAETRVSYGDSTEGGGREIQFSHVLGKTTQHQNVLLTYEYYKRDRVGSEERPFTASSDLTPLGGDDFRQTVSNPGNIVTPTQAAIPNGQDGTNLTPADLLLGQINLQNTNRGVDLFKEQERHSLFVTANHSLKGESELFAELRFSRRSFDGRGGGFPIVRQAVTDAHPYFVSPDPVGTSIRVNYNTIDDLGPTKNTGDVTSTGIVLGASFDLWNNWKADAYGLVSSEETDRRSTRVNRENLLEALGVDDPSTPFDPLVDGFFNVFGEGSNTPQNVLDYVGNGFRNQAVESQLSSLNLVVDGELFKTSGGSTKLAAGLEYRDERLETSVRELIGPDVVVSDSDALDQSRQIVALFAELLVPVFGPDNSRPGIHRLQFSASGRYEDYSDFGSTTNPKIGLLWAPVEGIIVRGTYGTSFKAPSLTQLSSVGIISIAFNAVDPSAPDGRTVGLFIQGPNPDLDSESSTAWTTGLDYSPPFMPGVTIGLTYFDIEFEDRIQRLPGSLFAAFSNQDVFAPVTIFDPDDALVQTYLDPPVEFQDFFGLTDASEIEAIVDGRINNLATTDVSGFDFNASFSFDTGVGLFDLGLNASYLTKFDESTSNIAPRINVMNTINNPIDLRIRASVGWTRGPISASAFVNFADDYRDNVSSPERAIDSWITVDMYAKLELGNLFDGVIAEGVDASLSVQNLFDEDPPFANNGIVGVAGTGYDRENANPLGRFISIQLTKSW